MNVFFDNTPTTFSRVNSAGNIGLHIYLALKKYSTLINPVFLYRKKSRFQHRHVDRLKRSELFSPINYNPYLSFHLPMSGKILHSTYHFTARLPFSIKIVHIHDTWMFGEDLSQSKREVKLLKRADHFTVMSESVKDELVYGWGIEQNRVTVIGYGCPYELERELPVNESVRHTLPFDPEELSSMRYVLTVGRIEPRKNYEHISKAIRCLPDLKWIVVGAPGIRGNEIAGRHFEPLIRDGRLIWLKNVEQPTLNLLYRNAFVFLLPSREEGFCIPLLEAMSFGIPVITSDRSANREIVADGGVLVSPENCNDSVHFIESLIQNPDLRDRFSQYAKERASEFKWSDVAAKLENLYLSVE